MKNTNPHYISNDSDSLGTAEASDRSEALEDYFTKLFHLKLIEKYGKIPSGSKLSGDFNKICGHNYTISSEAARKWIRGVSVPNGIRIEILKSWLGMRFSDGNKSTEQELSDEMQEIKSIYVHLTPRQKKLSLELIREMYRHS